MIAQDSISVLLDSAGLSKIERDSAEKLEYFHTSIKNVSLSDEVEYWVSQYESIIGIRNRYIFNWLDYTFRQYRFSSVSSKYQEKLVSIKILFTLFNIICDDIADEEGNVKKVNELMQIPLSDSTVQSKEKDVALAQELYQYLYKEISSFPLFQSYEKIFNFDLQQVMNNFLYALAINSNPSLINDQELKSVTQFNMMMYVFSDLDLMCSAQFPNDQIKTIRQVVYHAQYMGRIGNWVSTYEREILHGDFTSGVAAMALNQNPDILVELKSKNLTPKIKTLLNKNAIYLLKEWDTHRNELTKLSDSLTYINVFQLIDGMENILLAHLDSYGKK